MKRLKSSLILTSVFVSFISISAISQGKWTNYSIDNVLLSNKTTAILEDKMGNMWFGSLSGLNKYDGKNWTYFTEINGLANSSITYLFEDSKGVIWVGTVKGLSKFENDKISILGNKDGFPEGKPITTIFEDSKQRLWVGSLNLLLFDKNKWTTYSKKNNAIYKSGVRLITEDANGDIWVSSAARKGEAMLKRITNNPDDGGLSRFDGQSWQVFTKQDGFPATNRCIFRAHLFDKKGNAWFGSCILLTTGKGVGSLMKYDGNKWTYYSNKNDLIDDCVKIIFQDSKDNIWIGTNRGISVYNGSTWKSYSKEDSLTNNRIREIKEDSQGNIWIGTENGLCVYDGTNWKEYNEGKELTDKLVNVIYEDKSGNIWVGTGNKITKSLGWGIAKYDGTNWTIENALLGKLVYWIEEDSKGNLWFLSLDGISKYTPDSSLPQNDQ